jgi:hypothetical protein
LALLLALLAGCAALRPDPVPLPGLRFGEFTVTEAGGIDGRYNVLKLRPDGVGLYLSTDSTAGRVNQPTMDRLKELFESTEFRAEAARPAPKPTQQCSDQISDTIQLGEVSMSREAQCQPPEDKPAFDEILRLVNRPLRGEFDQPLSASQPRLQPLTVERTGYDRPDYLVRISATGTAELVLDHAAARRARLSQDRQDALRLIQDWIGVLPAPTPCPRPGSHRITVGSAQPLTVTRCMQRFDNVELWSIILLAQHTFDLS